MRRVSRDGGGIHEEGTPEEIFDRPRKERTRRFIRNLKVLEIAVRSSAPAKGWRMN